MAALITQVEIKNLVALQTEIHSVAQNEPIDSIFNYTFRKVTWYRLAPEQLKSTNPDQQKGEAVYTASSNYHMLLCLNKRMILPELRIKDQHKATHRIAWCHNVNNNNTVIARMKIGDVEFNAFDHVWADIACQYYAKPGFERHLSFAQGNIPFLEEWNINLPAKATNSIQPFYFREHPSVAVPLYMMSSQTKVTFEYEMRLKVSQLLRMAKFVDKNGTKVLQSIKFDPDILVDHAPQIPTPEMWGIYAHMTDDEVARYTCENERVFYIRNVVAADAENPIKMGANAKVELDSTYPSLALFWVAENRLATQKNNRSNYSTNSENLYEGWNPCSAPSLSYANHKRLKDIPPDFFDTVEPILHFSSAPTDPGYNAYSVSHNSSGIDAEVGIPFGVMKAKLQVPIKDSNPFLTSPWVASSKEDEVGESDDITDDSDTRSSVSVINGKSKEEISLFHLRTRSLVMQKIVATKNVETTKADDKASSRSGYTFRLV